MKNSKPNPAPSIGFSALLTIAFIVLKLCNVIKWSWWWVLSPLWIETIIVLVMIVVACLLISAHGR